MNRFEEDVTKIKTLLRDALTAADGLNAGAEGVRLQRTLETTLRHFEEAALTLRTLCETHSPGVGGYGKPGLTTQEVTGSVGLLEGQWLHIRLKTLLPHCRYQSPAWLTDTLRRLLDGYERTAGKLPYFGRGAVLVIDEHSELAHRKIYDQDNRGWKAVSNALKGRVIPDDDARSLSLFLTARESPANETHITLMDSRDAADFISLRSGSLGNGDVYQLL